jgi:hypothetical protein
MLMLLAILAAAMSALLALGQCPGGNCPLPQEGRGNYGFQSPAPRPTPHASNLPTPAWRYEKAVGHRAAVVRVICEDGGNQRSIGSGVAVRWQKRIVILTAQHVIKDAKKIHVETHKKKVHKVRVLKADATWDCAVLEFDGEAADLDVAQLELGSAAMFAGGERLESCGYGPDGQLAVNSGLFQGYRRTTTTPNGPDDWMVISGHARGGDSGGPIFNSHGKVVGVLWGTDGAEVVGVQAGRLHVLLDAAVPQTVEQKGIQGFGDVGRRDPTPAKTLAPRPSPHAPLLPWRGEAEKSQNAQDQRIERLIDLIDKQQSQLQQPPVIETPNLEPQIPESPNPESPVYPLLAGLCILGGVIVGFVLYFARNGG